MRVNRADGVGILNPTESRPARHTEIQIGFFGARQTDTATRSSLETDHKTRLSARDLKKEKRNQVVKPAPRTRVPRNKRGGRCEWPPLIRLLHSPAD